MLSQLLGPVRPALTAVGYVARPVSLASAGRLQRSGAAVVFRKSQSRTVEIAQQHRLFSTDNQPRNGESITGFRRPSFFSHLTNTALTRITNKMAGYFCQQEGPKFWPGFTVEEFCANAVPAFLVWRQKALVEGDAAVLHDALTNGGLNDTEAEKRFFQQHGWVFRPLDSAVSWTVMGLLPATVFNGFSEPTETSFVEFSNSKFWQQVEGDVGRLVLLVTIETDEVLPTGQQARMSWSVAFEGQYIYGRPCNPQWQIAGVTSILEGGRKIDS